MSSMERSASRAFDVSNKYNDSGVVMSMSPGFLAKRARSAWGVSPVRIETDDSWKGTSSFCAACAMPTSGARKFRSTSTAKAFIGEMYKTRQRCVFAGSGVNMMRLMHHRNAANVFPVPVGARMSVDSPRAIAGQPAVCGLVGDWNTASNQWRTAG